VDSALLDILERLGAPPAPAAARDPWLIVDAAERPELRTAYLRLRRDEFVARQGLFARDDRDEADADPRTVVLVAMTQSRTVLGGVRLHPSDPDPARPELGWWRGSRLVVDAVTGAQRGTVGAALVRAACARALDLGALRFDAHVQARQVGFFRGLGWQPVCAMTLAGTPHELMRWPIERFAALASATKQPLAALVGDLLPHDPWRGDDGYPLPGTDTVACVDAITPAMVQRDPEWAGWCGLLVTAHDLAAMGAAPVGALDALGAPDAAHAARVIDGLRAGAEAFALPVLGGHTQLGVHAALSITGLGRTARPVPAGGGLPGDALTLTADVEGDWRPGYAGRQWDSTSWRTRAQLAPMLSAVARAQPHAAKDVSMAGIVGTTGMLAEASGCGAELDVAQIVRPAGAGFADWLTCFPGFAVLTADAPGAPPPRAGAARSAPCGALTREPGVRLRWPDGEVTTALATAAVSGLGAVKTTSEITP
jgi:putative N-acetyltransferase (TIGR04045 family)